MDIFDLVIRCKIKLALKFILNYKIFGLIELIIPYHPEKFLQISLFIQLNPHQLKVSLIHQNKFHRLTCTYIRLDRTTKRQVGLINTVLLCWLSLKWQIFLYFLNQNQCLKQVLREDSFRMNRLNIHVRTEIVFFTRKSNLKLYFL